MFFITFSNNNIKNRGFITTDTFESYIYFTRRHTKNINKKLNLLIKQLLNFEIKIQKYLKLKLIQLYLTELY